MTQQIPGVPDGWELVGICSLSKGDWFVGFDGKTYQAEHSSGQVWPIIRKIEKPAMYRPFANAREADQLWNVALRIANSTLDGKDSRFRINTIGCDGITIGRLFYSYKAAFDGFCIDDDGSPFGVKIDE